MNDNAKAWVKALRSGEYQQAQATLREGDAYCCLGVACELYRQTVGKGEWGEKTKKGTAFLGTLGHLTPPVQDWLGLSDGYGSYGSDRTHSLTERNDAGATFSEIAEIIESEPVGLFS